MASRKTKICLTFTAALVGGLVFFGGVVPAASAGSDFRTEFLRRTTISPEDVPQYDDDKGVMCHLVKSGKKNGPRERICLRVA